MLKTSPDSPIFANLKTNFNTYKNIIRRSIVEAKKLYYKNTLKKNSNNLRKTWNTINETLNRNKKSKRPLDEFYLSNGNISTDHKITIDEFNKYFVSIGGSVGISQSNIMNYAFHTYLTDKPNCTLKFKLINVTEIIDIMNKLKPKSSSGVDDLSNKVIKHIQEIIAEPLTIIINQMLNTGIFPDSLKISKFYHYLKR